MSYNLLFDIGNVIVFFDFQITIRRIASQCRLPQDELLDSVRGPLVEFELGKIEPDEFLEVASQRIGYTGEKAFLRKSLEEVFELNDPMVQLIEEESKKGTSLYILSNTNDIHIPYILKNYGAVFECFDDVIYSHKVGLMKPDPRIFEEVESRFSIDPKETIYIDDLPENCAAGAEAGFLPICYQKNSHEIFLGAFNEMTQKPGLPQN